MQFLFDAVRLGCPMLGAAGATEIAWDDFGIEQPPDDDENTQYVWLESPMEFNGRHDGPVITCFASPQLKMLVGGHISLWCSMQIDALLVIQPPSHEVADKVDELLDLRDTAEAWVLEALKK